MNQSNREATPGEQKSTNSIIAYAETNLPTEYGTFRVVVFQEVETGKEHLAIIAGDIEGKQDVLVRVHSECLTGEVLHSRKCDCREQLETGLERIAESGCGVVIYLRQEGRGIGLGNKIRAYALQEAGHDTVDANRLLGFGDDLRTYEVAVEVLRYFHVDSVRLMTNNPGKLQFLRAHGIEVEDREEIFCDPNPHSIDYFRTKKRRMGHMFEDQDLHSVELSGKMKTPQRHNGLSISTTPQNGEMTKS